MSRKTFPGATGYGRFPGAFFPINNIDDQPMMEVLCPARGAVPAVILCECQFAVELDREPTPCALCGRKYTKEGRKIPPATGGEQ